MITRNIFLVDDDEDDQQSFVEAVNEIDNSICLNQAKNGVEALAKLNNMHKLPDLIFMDINMPLMNGLECLGHLKNHIRFKDIPVVILTSSNNPVEAKLAKTIGASFFLTKPSIFSMLKRNITDMLNLYFPSTTDHKKYEYISTSSLPAGMESHIISLLEQGLS